MSVNQAPNWHAMFRSSSIRVADSSRARQCSECLSTVLNRMSAHRRLTRKTPSTNGFWPSTNGEPRGCSISAFVEKTDWHQTVWQRFSLRDPRKGIDPRRWECTALK